MSTVRKSLALSTLDSYIGLALQLLSTVVIARILTPEQTGIFAVAAVFAALASTFRDFGVAEYLIQEKDLTRDRIRAALSMNIIVSWSMAFALAGSAVLVGRYYGNAAIGDVMLVQALNFLLIPFGAVTQAWFRRELNYVPIVICNVLANVSAFAVSVTLALQGWGHMALAWGSLAGIVVTVVAVALQTPAGFPRLPGWREIGTVFHFGKFASGIYIVAQIGKGAPELIIGRAAGMAEVGMFSRARGLVEMFTRLAMRPVLQVCMPYFAKADRERGSITGAYVHSVSYLTAMGWPFLGFLTLAAYSAIHIVYGDQWLQAVPASQVLCLACCIDLPSMLSREALLARGEARRAGVLQLQLLALQLIGLSAALPYGLLGASYGLLAAAALGLFVTQWHLQRAIGLGWGDLLRACRASLLLTAFTLAPLAAMTWFWPIGESNFGRYGVGGGLAVLLLWLLGLRLLAHPLWQEISALGASLGRRLARS